MNANIKFISDNFIEQEALCKLSELSTNELEKLIDAELIPNASYTIKSTFDISSPLGDRVSINETKRYFPKNTVKLIETNRMLKNASAFKEKFKSEYIKALENHESKKYAYGNILNEDGSFNIDKLDAAFEEEWKHYCNGIYGICTLNATASEISKKEIAVKKLIEFSAKNKGEKLEQKEMETLKSLNDEYNEISNLFAPYQRDSSSRGKYLDENLKSNSLSELIINYD